MGRKHRIVEIDVITELITPRDRSRTKWGPRDAVLMILQLMTNREYGIVRSVLNIRARVQ
jgi:hypothetical protein